ncbi:DUF551 domain-containing protein [Escherichia coli]|uniref:DUF551 domain-containing protein n=1 Tax=Escherichia coli TaxID=562 RepID=UPI0022704FCC|nr:DUF551 domain-containing protein [Escherichia coli]
MTTPITKEQLKEWVAQLDSGDGCDATDRQLEVLIRQSLAVMDAEPVAVINGAREPVLYGEHIGIAIGTHLYTAPPAPVCSRPVHPAISSEELDDETLDELIEFRRSTFEYHSQQGNKVQTIIHGVTLTALLELRERRAAMLNHAENERDMVERVSQSYKLPSQSSDAVNEAAWKLHETLTEHGPLNGHQFNNLKGCFYEALKVAMCNSPAIPDGWVACSERMPDTDGNYWGWWSESNRQGPVWFIKSEIQAQFQSSEITHWMPLPAAPQKEGM